MTHVVRYQLSGYKIPLMIADTVTVGLKDPKNTTSMWIVVFGTAAEEHVVVYVFFDTFVTVKRMKLPSSEEFHPQFVNHYSSYCQKDYCYNYNGEAYNYHKIAIHRIDTKIIRSGL